VFWGIGFTAFPKELVRLFIKADNRAILIVRQSVNIKDILHFGHKICVLLRWDAPHGFQVRLNTKHRLKTRYKGAGFFSPLRWQTAQECGMNLSSRLTTQGRKKDKPTSAFLIGG